MKRKLQILILLILIAVFAVLFIQWGKKSQNSDIYLQLTKLEPSKKIETKIQGQYFLLHFWAKWCAPCAEEIPHLVSFAEHFSKDFPQFNVLAVSLDPSLSVSKSILPHNGDSLPGNFILMLDPEHWLADQLGSFQFPETYLYGPNGQIVEKWVGPQKWETPEVIEYFKKIVMTNH